jgi:hypothetical protein
MATRIVTRPASGLKVAALIAFGSVLQDVGPRPESAADIATTANLCEHRHMMNFVPAALVGFLFASFFVQSDHASASSRLSPKSVGDVNFIPTAGQATKAEIARINEAGKIANEVIHSDCFRDFMVKRNLIRTTGRTNVEVVEHLQGLSGTVPVAMYYRCLARSPACSNPTPALAYRQPPEQTIYLNTAHFDVSDPSVDAYEWASTLGHEAWGHLLGGYEHDFNWSEGRDFTVPYSIGGSSMRNSDAFQSCRGILVGKIALGSDATRR